MSVAKFSVGKSGAGGANAGYITRQPDAEKIAFYNLGHLVVETNAERRTNAIAYAYAREDVEKDKSKNARTHYRMILSWDRKEDSEKASAEAEKYLDKVLPKAKAILAVHQDTDHTHVHIWIDARQTDDKKINLRGSEYTTLDEKWARHYDAEYSTSYAEEYKIKKKETRKWKQEKMISKSRQDVDQTVEVSAKPEHLDKFSAKYWREKELRQITTENNLFNFQIGNSSEQTKEAKNEQNRNGGNQRISPRESECVGNTESTVEGTESSNLADQYTSGGTKSAAETQNRPDDFSALESGGNYQSSADYGDGVDKSEYKRSFSRLYDFGIGDKHSSFTDGIVGQESFEAGIYEDKIRQSNYSEGDAFTSIQQTFSQIEGFEAIGYEPTELIKPFEIIFDEVKVKQSDESLVQSILQMAQESFDRQGIQLSREAFELYRETLFKNAAIPLEPQQIKTVEKFNQNKPDAEQIDLNDKSKLEFMHEVLSIGSDKNRDTGFRNAAEEVEGQAEAELERSREQEQQQEMNELFLGL
jgi:Relaxase/Mobilisation nuclease domain